MTDFELQQVETQGKAMVQVVAEVRRVRIALRNMPCACPGKVGELCPKCAYFAERGET